MLCSAKIINSVIVKISMGLFVFDILYSWIHINYFVKTTFSDSGECENLKNTLKYFNDFLFLYRAVKQCTDKLEILTEIDSQEWRFFNKFI